MASIRRTYILTMALKMTVTNAKVRCSASTNAREICCEETEKEWPKKSVELQREIMLLRTPINKTVITLGPFPHCFSAGIKEIVGHLGERSH